MTANQIFITCAGDIHGAFESYHGAFQDITRNAKSRFEHRDWPGAQADAVRRLDLHRSAVDGVVEEIKRRLGPDAQHKHYWIGIREIFSGLISGRDDVEIAHTFFNSVTRRVLDSVGVDPDIEYLDEHFDVSAVGPSDSTCHSYPGRRSTADVMKNILKDYPFTAGYRNAEEDARRAADRIDAHLASLPGSMAIDSIEMMKSVFYRNRGAYLIGRMRCGSQTVPLVLALLNPAGGVSVDAVLFTSDEASIVFSFTRSYFQVAARRPHEVIEFLKSIMPLKPVAELYTSIGYHKYGKTELYRDLLRHFESSDDTFEIARGERGMVMIVFTLQGYDVVFKIIKDRFGSSKTSTRQQVKERYRLVFQHDRAGRLVDAQEFEHLEFRKDRFSPPFLTELLDAASGTVKVSGGRVVIDHVYTERKLTPLNIYIKEEPPERAREAILDYGHAIKDLAGANIFPGDILLKNFGVTRHGRVVFYDYDELCLLTDCRFREIPPTTDPLDEMASEPWYYVREKDVFPEEFKTFLGLDGDSRESFLNAHGDLLGVDYWKTMQDRICSGEIADIFPYRQSRRLGGV